MGVKPHTPALTIRDGIAYVQTHELHRNVDALAAAGPVVLVTHASDMTADDALAELIPPNVTAWYSMNAATTKARPLPIGLRSDWDGCEILTALRAAADAPKGNRAAYLCATWNTPSLPEAARVERRKLYGLFVDAAWVTCRGGNTAGDVPPAQFFADMRAHRYVLCPRGAGYDCHRFYEALYLGAIPIIRHSDVMARLDCFPALRVWDWSQVTPELLEREYPRLAAEVATCVEPLTAGYWTKAIRP